MAEIQFQTRIGIRGSRREAYCLLSVETTSYIYESCVFKGGLTIHYVNGHPVEKLPSNRATLKMISTFEKLKNSMNEYNNAENEQQRRLIYWNIVEECK